jgi:iron only hydrogenase large subunit-like protein/nitrogen-specific signal transduction histidine kinase
MKLTDDKSLVTTIGEHCRICYTCVRKCPAKAIRIAEGQANVLPHRCIACGNCVRVCALNAKQALDSTDDVRDLLDGDAAVAAILAPSFPAEFTECHWTRMVGMLRELGFASVHEVAFGADLVAERYRQLFEENPEARHIATTCPAVVAYVERYHPDSVGYLSPIVSPMVAVARALHEIHGTDLKIVFIGPCIAKKGELASELLENSAVDAALTFVELRAMIQQADLDPHKVEPADFDPPHAGSGALFPISRGLFHAADIPEDLFRGDVVTAEGRRDFVEAVKEFDDGHLGARMLEALACNGCIMGPGVTGEAPLFSRRTSVRNFVHERWGSFDSEKWQDEMERFTDLDLSRTFAPYDQRIPVLQESKVQEILNRMGKSGPAEELNCGACGYDTCREHAVAIIKGLAESEMCLPHTIEKLHTTIDELASSNELLASAQEALMQSEKLASMGQLAAGIAHEVNNPLGVVLMYSHLLLDEHGENETLRGDLAMITEQADRCKRIVSGLLNFARQTKVLREPTDICKWIDSTLPALQPPARVTVVTEHNIDDPIVEIDRDQTTQILTNLVTNAYAAMENGGTLTVTTDGKDDQVRICVSDTGAGIPPENRKKIFEPFFTTKQMGRGTGLGLSVTYGIVKMHSGSVSVESNHDPAAGPTGTTFTVSLPRKAPLVD